MKKFCLFSYFMKTNHDNIKNLKISEKAHTVLKKYCEDKGLKIHKFVEKLIYDNCQVKKDIYGED